MHTHASLHLSRLAIPLLLALGTHSVASAAVRLVAVPAKPTDLAVPHFSYNGRVTTFKAIARGFPDVAAAGAARFRWDFDGDGTWDTPLTAPRQIVTGTPDGVSAYDLGAQSMGRLRTPERGYRKKRGLGAFAGQESIAIRGFLRRRAQKKPRRFPFLIRLPATACHIPLRVPPRSQSGLPEILPMMHLRACPSK